ncbi:hypothetical protein PIROE2DRAFT_20786, partial [Piromyces sp. E2]
MVNSKLLKSIKNRKYFNRGNRCYGIPLTSLCMIFIRGIRSWPEPQLWKFLNKNFKDEINSFISFKYTNHFGDSFFRVKVKLTLEQSRKICSKLEALVPYITASYNKVSHFINKKSFKNIKRGLLCSKSSTFKISNNTSTYPHSHSSTLSNNSSQATVPSNSFVSSTVDSSFTANNDSFNQKFSFCLSWNTNGWNFSKRDGIEYFNYIFKPLFLCFQETGNGSKLDDDIFCKVTVRNYRYFRKKTIVESPGMRGLFLGYHRSCQ